LRRCVANFFAHKHGIVTKRQQKRLDAVEKILGARIEDDALGFPDVDRIADDGAVEIFDSERLSPGLHLPGVIGRAGGQLHKNLAGERRLKLRSMEELAS